MIWVSGNSKMSWSRAGNKRWWVVKARRRPFAPWDVLAAPEPGMLVERFAEGFWTKKAAQNWAIREDKFYGGKQ